MNILHDDERTALIESLRFAPDEILLDAVRQVKEWRHGVQKNFEELRKYCGLAGKELPTPNFSKAAPPPVEAPAVQHEAATGVNKKPPGTACSRVGGETKEKITTRCMKPSTLIEINKFLGRGEGKLEETKSLLKLLWDRGEITYDGSTYTTVRS